MGQICNMFEGDWILTIMLRARFSFPLNSADEFAQASHNRVQVAICHHSQSSVWGHFSRISIIILISMAYRRFWVCKLGQPLRLTFLIWPINYEREFFILSMPSITFHLHVFATIKSVLCGISPKTISVRNDQVFMSFQTIIIALR
jgi:hypothetical protein